MLNAVEPGDRAYLKRRIALCREKAAVEPDRGLARIYRNFADAYERALGLDSVEPEPGKDAPRAGEPFMLAR